MRSSVYCIGVITILSSLTIALAQNQPARAPAAPKAAAKATVSATKAPATNWKQPRTPDGKPDFSGYWSNATVTPLERPAGLAGKDTLNADDAKRLEETGNRSEARSSGRGGVGDYNALWYDQGLKVLSNNRTSIITDPANGRIPALTAAAIERRAADRAWFAAHEADGPEDFDTIERCITWTTSGPPMLPTWYNNAYQLVQSKDKLVVVTEMVHDARIIPIDNSPHVSAAIRQWMGDSRAHWEGDTLVVETTNFNGKRGMIGGRGGEGPVAVEPTPEAAGNRRGGRGGGAAEGGNAGGGGGRSGAGRNDEKMKVTERFTRTAADVLNYQFTVDDPGTYTRNWSGEIPMRSIEGPVYEYACHEGNYAMMDILGGARAQEKEEAAAKSKTSPRK